MLAITFRDGFTVSGSTATDILRQMTGGFNPTSVTELRQAFLRRAGTSGLDRIAQGTICNDLDFLKLCAMPPINLWKFCEDIEQPFGVVRANRHTWAVTAKLPKNAPIAN